MNDQIEGDILTAVWMVIFAFPGPFATAWVTMYFSRDKPTQISDARCDVAFCIHGAISLLSVLALLLWF